VIRNVSLEIEKGQSVAFVGKSGAGKTTLVDLLLGLLTPQHGDITVDGHSIYENMTSWRKLIGYIPQSIFLMNDTIERNVAFGLPRREIDEEQLWKAIAGAQLMDFIDDLAEGIQTKVGDQGVRLSGGQRQRVGIARALYHQREVIVLDEATSALDTETEKQVSDAINALAGSKTLIMIAHRLSTIEKCDQIFVLEDGRIARAGAYHDIFVE
jgi:ABC-type multidrug transport system fused ATPase/permease subunit